MENFAKRMREAMDRANMTASDLAASTGIARSSISRYLRGVMLPKQTYTDLIANALRINPGYLMTGVAQRSSLNDVHSYHIIPVGVSAGALESIDAISTFDTLEVPDILLGRYARNKKVVFMHVNGESMNNVIESGSLIAVLTGIEKESLSNGDIVIASNGGEGYTVKRFYDDPENSRVILRPDSTDMTFLPIVIPYENAVDFRIFGRVVIYQVIL